MEYLKKGPSPAMIVAAVAMAFALVGTAVAANDGAIYPKLTKSKVKKIANKQIDKAAPNLSVASAEQATTADEAKTVGGQTPHKIFTKIASGTAATTALEVNGLKLTAACTAGGDLQFAATTSVDDSIFGSNVINGAAVQPATGGTRASNFDTGNTLDVIQGLPRGAGSFTYSTPDGSYVSGTFTTDDANTFGTFNGCVVVGTAFSG